MKFHIDILNSELKKRIGKNKRYSLRAFAKQMGLHPSSMSRVLNNKQTLSSQAGLRVMRKLELDLSLGRKFLKSIADSRHENECVRLGHAIGKPKLTADPIVLDEATCAEVSSLPCIALMELAQTDDFHMNTLWMSERLGLPLEKVDQILDLLLQNGLIVERDNRLVKTEVRTTTVNEETTNALRIAHQKEILDKARWAVENISFEQRCNHSLTVATDPAKIPEAKRRIKEFIEDLCDFLESGSKKEIYEFSAQLFPLSQIRSNEPQKMEGQA